MQFVLYASNPAYTPGKCCAPGPCWWRTFPPSILGDRVPRRGHAVGNHLPSLNWQRRPCCLRECRAAARGHFRRAGPGRPYQRFRQVSRRAGLPARGPGSGTPQGCLPPRLLSKSAGRLAKIRKRSQLGEILPIRYPAPFSRLPRIDPRGAATRVWTFASPTTKSPTRREVLERELVPVPHPRRAGMNN